MILSRSESKDGDTSGSLTNGQLLHDIESISKALYLHKSNHNVPIITSSTQHQFSGGLEFSDHGLVAKQKSSSDVMVNKVTRSSPSWNWKKPLKALSHIRDRKLSCLFFLHVHSIEGLPPKFNGYNLSVQFARKNQMITTRRSQVLNGMADFDETLMHRCTLYCHRSGPENSCKYEPKIFLIQASLLGSWGHNIGKHWVDLTRLLPLTLDELDAENSSGKWTTSFKLAGDAKGAILNVSFGYLLASHAHLMSSRNMTVSQLINLSYRSNVKQTSTSLGRFNSFGRLSRSESFPGKLNKGFLPLSQLVDENICHEPLISPASELSKSIHFLCQKLDEDELNSSTWSDTSSKQLGRSKKKADSDQEAELVEQIDADEDEEIEFEVIEKGVELEVTEKEEASAAENAVPGHNFSGTDKADVNKIFVDDGVTYGSEVKYNRTSLSSSHKDEFAFYEFNKEKQSECATELSAEELSDFGELSMSESLGLTFQAEGENCDTSSYMEVKSSYKENKLAKRSLSMDDISESVASDFLNMLENDHLLPEWHSDGDPESPRERLLRDFELEALVSGNFLLSRDENGDESESSSGAQVESDFRDNSDDHMLAALIDAAERELDVPSNSLRHRRKAMMLEDIETEALLRQWGFDEKTFRNSPRCRSGNGFGSPIELTLEEESVKSSIGGGFRPSIRSD